MKFTWTLLATVILAAPLTAAPALAEAPAPDLTSLRALVAQGKYIDARPIAATAVKANPSSAEAHDLYARVLANVSKMDDAVREMSAAATLEPKNATYQVHLGEIQLAAFHVKFGDWVKSHNQDMLGDINRSVPTAMAGDPYSAIGGPMSGSSPLTVLTEEARINDRSASQMNAKEWEGYEKTVKASLAAYDAALALEPDNKAALQGKGIVSVLLGKWEDTITSFQKAGVPTFDSFLYELGRNMYVGHGKGEEAIKMWEMVVAAQPLNAWGYWYLREAYDEFHRGDWHYDYYDGMRMLFSDQIRDSSESRAPSAKDGLKALRSFSEKHPDFGPAWRGMGIANLKLKDRKAAAQAFQKAAELDPTDGYSLLQAGFSQLEGGDAATAQKTLSQAAKVRPGDYMAWYQLARAAEKNKDLDTALAAYERTADVAPMFAEAHFDAAAILLDRRQGAEALPHLEKYLALKPDAKNAKDVQKVVEQLKTMLASSGQ